MVSLTIPNFNNVIGTFEGLQQRATEFIRRNPLISGSIIGVSTAGATVGVVTALRSRIKKKRKKSTKRKSTKRKSKTKSSKKRKKCYRKTPYTARKGKDRSSKRIRYTKKGQPYVIMKSGKARFIKKSSAKKSHRLKGGRY